MLSRTTDGFLREGASVILLPRIAGPSKDAISLVRTAISQNPEHVFIDGRRMALHSESFTEALCLELAKSGVRQTSFVGGSPEWHASIERYLSK